MCMPPVPIFGHSFVKQSHMVLLLSLFDYGDLLYGNRSATT